MYTLEERANLMEKFKREGVLEAKLAKLFSANPKLFYMCYGKIKFVCDRLRDKEERCTEMLEFRKIQKARERLRNLSYIFERSVK